MSMIRITQACTEFGQAFTEGQVVSGMFLPHAEAMVASGLATPLAPFRPNWRVVLESRMVPITSVMHANPDGYELDEAPYGATFEYEGARFYYDDGALQPFSGGGGGGATVNLTQAQAENPASAVFGQVSGQRLAQAAAANDRGITATYATAAARIAGTGHAITQADIDQARLFYQADTGQLWTATGTPGAVVWASANGLTGISADAGNALQLGADLKPFLASEVDGGSPTTFA
jgi:hypothetical protein